MENRTRKGRSKAERGGDTSRSSSQGQKLSSGGTTDMNRNPEIDEATKSPIAGRQRDKRIGERKKAPRR